MLLVVGGTDIELADNFAARTTLTNSFLQLNTSNTLATAEVGEPVILPGLFNRSLWMQWIPAQSGIAVFDTAGSAQGTALAVYTGNSLNALTVTAVSGNDFPAASSRVVFNAVAGTPYQVQLIGGGGPTPFLCLNGQLTATTNAVPQIIQQPQSEYVEIGSNATLTVVAVLPPAITNGVITYQWFKEQAPLVNATNSTLNFPSMTTSNIAQYSVAATFNGLSVTSALASITGVAKSLTVGQGSIMPPLTDFGTSYSCGGITLFDRHRLFFFRVPASANSCSPLPCWPDSTAIDPYFQPATVSSGVCTPITIPSTSTKVTFSTANAQNTFNPAFDTGLYIWRFSRCDLPVNLGVCTNVITGNKLETVLVTIGSANTSSGLIKVFLLYKLPVPANATFVKLDYTYQ